MQRAKLPRRCERSKRCSRGVWPRSIATGRFLMSHLLHIAPRHCHLSSGRLDLRRRSQRTFESSSRSGATASRTRPRRQWILIRRFRARGLQLRRFQWILSRRHHCGDIYRFRLPCGQGVFPLSTCGAVCCGVSSGSAAGSRSVRECRRPAVAGCRRLSGSPSPGSARVTAGPAEQDSELCTMADFFTKSSS